MSKTRKKNQIFARIRGGGSQKAVPFYKLVPNIITLIGLVFGVSSIRLALENNWEMAVYCILAAAVIDGLDGRIARLLQASSPFGAELDSLCDLVNFGVCPAFIIYLWSYQQYEYRVISWAAILLFIVCMAIRLARFNTTASSNKDFFTGVPAPCGALLALFPLIIDFGISDLLNIIARNHTLFIDLYIIFIALLLPSRLSTFSAKNLQINPRYLYLSMMCSAIIIILLFIYTWYTLSILSIIYLLSIPFSEYVANKNIDVIE